MARDFENYAKLIEETDINAKDEDGASLLRIAVAFGSEDIALDLLARGIQIDQKDRSGSTELQNAFVLGLRKVAVELIDRGADLNHRNNHGNNALWYAATNPRPNYDMVRLLVEKGCDAKTKNRAGRSPIDAARERNDETLLEIFGQWP
jgi:ankyrin repeat protein